MGLLQAELHQAAPKPSEPISTGHGRLPQWLLLRLRKGPPAPGSRGFHAPRSVGGGLYLGSRGPGFAHTPVSEPATGQEGPGVS